MKYTYVTLEINYLDNENPSKSEITDLDMSCHDSTPYKLYDTREEAFTAALNEAKEECNEYNDNIDENDFLKIEDTNIYYETKSRIDTTNEKDYVDYLMKRRFIIAVE